MQSRSFNLSVVCLISLLVACATDQGKENKLEDTLAALQSKGLTCEVQKAITSFDTDETNLAQFYQMVSEKFSQEELVVLAEHRKTDCDQNVGSFGAGWNGQSSNKTVSNAWAAWQVGECQRACDGGSEVFYRWCWRIVGWILVGGDYMCHAVSWLDHQGCYSWCSLRGLL